MGSRKKRKYDSNAPISAMSEETYEELCACYSKILSQCATLNEQERALKETIRLKLGYANPVAFLECWLWVLLYVFVVLLALVLAKTFMA